MELLSAARLLVANLTPELDPASQVEALTELLNTSDHEGVWKAFEAAGGPEAVVQLFLAIDPACPSTLLSTKPSEEADSSEATSSSSTSTTPSSSSSTSSTSETSSTSDDAAVDSAPAPVISPDSAATEESTSTSPSVSTSTSQEDQEATPATTAVVDSAPATVDPDSAATEESTSTSPSVSTSTSTSQEDQEATPATTTTATTDTTTTTTTTEEPPSLVLQLARTVQVMSVKCNNRALVTSAEVAQQVAALYGSAATDTLTKVACVSYMAGLVMHNEAQPFASGAGTLRAALCRFVTETTLKPGVDPLVFTYSIYIFNRVLALTTEDKRYSLRSMFQHGLASHVLQQLQYSQQDQEFETARHALMETVVELASYADVATCRQILDAPLAACCVREMLRRLENSEWQVVADVMGVLKSLLSERTAPFRPARQRFQEVFVERGGEVSAATGRDGNVTGLDALVDVLNQGIPPLAPYVLATLTSLCDDNVNVQEAVRNNERAMDALRRITEVRHPGHDQAQELLLLLSLHHQA